MKIIAANWKLHKNPNETRIFFDEWKKTFQAVSGSKIIFFPPATSLEATSQALSGSAIEFGVQNAYCEAKGAFTGETSAQVVKDLGGKWVLVGHSERRKIFAEDDDLLAKKVVLAQSLGLTPMLCIGETLQERERGDTNKVLARQLSHGLAIADRHLPVAVAYEPVWAIGTGKVATPEQVQEAHVHVFQELQRLKFPEGTPILYGGSVKPENASELIRISHVDGFLVGGASLEVKSFAGICRAE